MAAPLAFDDVSAVSNYLTALSAHPDIVAAVVYDIDGDIVDSYRRDDDEPLPEAVQPGTVDYGAERVSVAVAVEQQELQLGVVYLQAVTQDRKSTRLNSSH